MVNIKCPEVKLFLVSLTMDNPMFDPIFLEARRVSGVVSNPNITVKEASVTVSNGTTTIYFTRSMKQGKNPIKDQKAHLIASFGNNKQIGHHKCRAVDQYFVDFTTSNSSFHVRLQVVHGFLMGTTFTLVYPFGISLARYFKLSLQENWFNFHVGVQLTGLVASLTAVVIAYTMVPQGRHFVTTHGKLGTSIMILVVLQALGGFLRPKYSKEDETKTFKRNVWELLHGILGKVIVLAAIPQIVLGFMFFNPGIATWSIWWPFVAFWAITIIILEAHRLFKSEGHDLQQEREPILRKDES